MNELNSEDIKEAIVKTLLMIAPNVQVYKEAVSNPIYPHFFVHQISVMDESSGLYHTLSYSMDIRYRTTSDPSTDLRLQKNLDEMSLLLLTNFNIIDFDGGKIRCSDKTTEKEDGVLHFFTTLKTMVRLEKKEKNIKQMKLEVKIDGQI